MYGVVLWSDRRLKHAVIWCEDHGDLAFLTPDEGAFEHADLAHGDVLAFDLDPDGSFRRAQNVRIIDSDAYPSLARSLTKLMESQEHVFGGDITDPASGPAMSNVLPSKTLNTPKTPAKMRRSAR